MMEKRPYGKIDDNKLIKALAEGRTKTEAGLVAGSKAKRHNLPDVVSRKSENVGFKDKLQEHIDWLQKYLTEDKIAEEDAKSLVWMLEKLHKINEIEGGNKQESLDREEVQRIRDIIYEYGVDG